MFFVTAHGSKGMEWEHTFIIGATSKWDAASRNHTYCLPPTVWRSGAGVSSEIEENRRLFYVAATRAKKQLSISWPAKDNNDKALEQSRFVAEFVEAGCKIINPLRTIFTTSRVTRHLLTNLWVTALFLPLRYRVEGEEGQASRVTITPTKES